MSISEIAPTHSMLSRERFGSVLSPGVRLLDLVTIVNEREGGLLEANVPISLIYREDVPYDHAHVRELADSIRREAASGKNTGQLSPILLGEIPTFPHFPIIDGFHRTPAMELLGHEEVFATIRPDSTWEEVVDLRILAATTHRAVRFSRLIEWVEESWHFSPWVDRLKPAQAFTLKVSKTMTGRYLGLETEEADEIRRWVERKCEQWHISPASIHNYLSTAAIADPELVKAARERRRGDRLDVLTPQHLSAVARILPHRYDMQREVAEVAKKHALTVPRARAVAASIAKAETVEEAREIIATGNWEKIAPLYQPRTLREHRRLGRGEQETGQALNQEVLELILEEEMEIARLTIENAILAGRYSPGGDGDGRNIIPAEVSEISPEMDDPEFADPNIPTFAEIGFTESGGLPEEQIESIIREMYDAELRVRRHLFYRFNLSPEDAEDIFQQAITNSYAYLKKGTFVYESEKSSHAFIMRAAHNVGVSRYRKVSKMNIAYTTIDDLANVLPEIEQDREDPRYRELIKRALPHLVADDRRLLVLRAFFDLNENDVARIIGEASDGAIRVRSHRAVERISKLIEDGKIEKP